MADNYLERQYDDYLRQKEKKNAQKRLKWRKQLEEYKKKIANKSKQENANDA